MHVFSLGICKKSCQRLMQLNDLREMRHIIKGVITSITPEFLIEVWENFDCKLVIVEYCYYEFRDNNIENNDS